MDENDVKDGLASHFPGTTDLDSDTDKVLFGATWHNERREALILISKNGDRYPSCIVIDSKMFAGAKAVTVDESLRQLRMAYDERHAVSHHDLLKS